ncbi:MAG: metallophosphoesterase [Planctomycetes bacterium]|nr:metallophosphoesterase [Planctomycetota bacterium]
MRIVHLSDVHVEVPASEVKLRDLLGRRFAGWVNLHFGPRKKHFVGAGERLERALQHARALSPDFGIVSGDLTAIGVREEFARARALLAPLVEDASRWLVIAGNHDRYTVPAEREGLYEQFFGAWRRPGVSSPGRTTPYLRFAGDLPLVVVETCEANRFFWDSRGCVETAELAALRELLQHEALRGRPYWLVTHYAPYGPGGKPDHGLHGLKNLDELLEVLRPQRPQLWLHGHIHWSYALLDGEAEFATVNAGSATHHARPSLHLYERDARGWTLRSYDPSGAALVERWSRRLESR